MEILIVDVMIHPVEDMIYVFSNTTFGRNFFPLQPVPHGFIVRREKISRSVMSISTWMTGHFKKNTPVGFWKRTFNNSTYL